MTRPAQIVILGGGAAGLAAGFYARRRGLTATILEAGADVGGNARTLVHGPFRFDTGAHRFHDRDPHVTADVRALLGDDLLEVAAPSQICWQGTMLDFPLTPLNALGALGPRLSLRAARDVLVARMARGEAGTSFEAVATRRYGRTLADLFLLGYSEKLWGVPCRELSPAVAGARLQGLSVRMLARELRRRTGGRAAHLEGRFFYPKLGIGMIADRLAESCGPDAIARRSRVTRLLHDDGAIVGVEVNHRETIDVSTAEVISTLPPTVMAGLFDPALPARVLTAARALRFRHVVLVTLMVNRPSVTASATIYFPEPDYAFTRLSEPRNRSPWLAPPGCTSLSLEIPCWADDAVWTATDDTLIARCTADLGRSGLIDSRHVSGGVVHRLPFAYPVLELATEGRVREVDAHVSRFANLHVVGRAGRFEYVHVHDLVRAGRELVERIAATLARVETGVRS